METNLVKERDLKIAVTDVRRAHCFRCGNEWELRDGRKIPATCSKCNRTDWWKVFVKPSNRVKRV